MYFKTSWYYLFAYLCGWYYMQYSRTLYLHSGCAHYREIKPRRALLGPWTSVADKPVAVRLVNVVNGEIEP